MTMELPSGLLAKTGFLPDPEKTIDDSWLQYVELDDSRKFGMDEVVADIGRLCRDPALLQDMVFKDLLII